MHGQQNMKFFNCCAVESDGAIFEAAILLGYCAVSTEVLEDHLVPIFISGSVSIVRFYGAQNC